MKKILCMTLLTLYTFTHANDEKLSPELEEFITVKPLEDKDLDGNLYVGLVGMFLPQDNYIEITKEYFKKNDSNYLGWREKMDKYSYEEEIPLGRGRADLLNLELSGFSPNLLLSCMKYLDDQCVSETIDNKNRLEKILKQNEVLLNRYKWLIDNSIYYQGFSSYAFSTIPRYHDIYFLHSLLLREIILKIEQGKVEEGIDQLVKLREMINLYFSPQKETDIINTIPAIELLQHYDQVLDGLLSSGLLDTYLQNSKIVSVFKPFSTDKIGTFMQKSVINEFKNAIKRYSPTLIANDKENKATLTLWQDYFLLEDKNTEPSLSYLNQYYLALNALDDITKKGKIVSQSRFNEITNVINLNRSFLYDVLNTYSLQAIEQQNYHQLVYLKYRIMKDKIAYDDIPKFLESMGDLAKNTVTKEPYQFDAETGILSTPLPELKYRPSQVRSGDKEIVNFQVTIQK